MHLGTRAGMQYMMIHKPAYWQYLRDTQAANAAGHQALINGMQRGLVRPPLSKERIPRVDGGTRGEPAFDNDRVRHARAASHR